MEELQLGANPLHPTMSPLLFCQPAWLPKSQTAAELFCNSMASYFGANTAGQMCTSPHSMTEELKMYLPSVGSFLWGSFPLLQP